MNLVEKFNSVDLNERANLTWKNGEFIVGREYYGMKVCLYLLPGFYVEVAFNPITNLIERVEAFTDPKSLDKFLPYIELKD